MTSLPVFFFYAESAFEKKSPISALEREPDFGWVPAWELFAQVELARVCRAATGSCAGCGHQ